MNRVAINLGFIQIYWYSIFVLLGIIAAFSVVYFESKRKKIDENFLLNLAFYTIIFGIIGARLYYVLFNMKYYLNAPLQILAIWNGGLAIHGGIIAGALVVIYHCKKYKVNTLKMFDILVVGLIIGQAIGRWGNFFNGEAFGRITTLAALKAQHIPMFIIKGMNIAGEYREPTFLYESIWCLIGFIILLIIRRNKKIKIGQLTGFYLVWYGLERLIVEGLRSDSLMLGPLKIAQLISIVFIITGIVLFIYNIKKSTKEDPKLYNETHTIKKKNK